MAENGIAPSPPPLPPPPPVDSSASVADRPNSTTTTATTTSNDDDDVKDPSTLEEFFLMRGTNPEGVSDVESNAFALCNVDVTGAHISLNRIKCLAQYEPAYMHFFMTNKDLYNIPFSFLGSNPLFHNMLLAMFYSSISNDCEYCTCIFTGIAVRKSSSVLERMIYEDQHDPSDVALIRMAEAMGRYPADLTTDELVEAKKYYTTDELERIVMSIANCGGDNFLSQSLGVKLEWDILSQTSEYLAERRWNPGRHAPEGFEMPKTASETTTSSENQQNQQQKNKKKTITKIEESLFPFFKLLGRGNLQRTIVQEMKWKTGIPSSWPRVGQVLKEKTGYCFPLLQKMDSFRNVCACFGAILRDSFDDELTKIGLLTKALCQIVWSTVVDDEHLQEDGLRMVPVFAARQQRKEEEEQQEQQQQEQQQQQAEEKKEDGTEPTTTTTVPKIDARRLEEEIMALGDEPAPETEESCREAIERLSKIRGIDTAKTAAVLVLARAASNKPTKIEPVIIREIVVRYLDPPEVTETLMWLAVLISFHRILRFYEIKDNTPCWIWDDKRSKPLPRRNTATTSCSRSSSSTTGSVTAEQDPDSENNNKKTQKKPQPKRTLYQRLFGGGRSSPTRSS